MATTPTRSRAAAALVLAVLGAAALPACNFVGAFGAIEESRRRNSTREVKAEYAGLRGKSFAVVVSADRITQADHPEVVARLTAVIAETLRSQAEAVGASGYVPGDTVVDWQYNNPRWVTMAMSELAKELDVQRIIYVDLSEYRLNDPGNPYLWAGVASGNVAVTEADGPIPDEFVFQRQVKVEFPDQGGFGPAQIPRAAVNTELARRFATRASWLFFNHQEPYYPDF